MATFERREGLHFLTDYYELFKLEQFEPDTEKIKAAYRKFMMLHNVDRHRGLAGEEEAERMTRLGNLAYETLGNSARKAAYDKRLADWEGPISDDGIPVVLITNPFWSLHGPLAVGPAIEMPEAKHEEYARAQSGDDTDLFAYLQDRSTADGKGALLYLKALLKRADYWRWRIEMRRMTGGLETAELPAIGVAVQLRELQATEHSRAEATWQELVLAIEAGKLKAITASTTETEVTPSADSLQLYHQQALERFEATTAATEQFAAAHDTVVEELTTPLYVPAQEEFFGKLVLVLLLGNTTMRFAFTFDGTHVQQIEDLDEVQLQAVDKPDVAAKLHATGWNIAYVGLPKGGDPMRIINVALECHYDKLLAQGTQKD
jgi:curved DNA-binding protein CbpA